ncbi:MAG: hypothetical protein PHE86_03955 [Candidatus Marinimicrobia bacterium]|nr:hypothetical protein [Candidatus Neomarinimicrobiota bacterium]MDD5581775.1 hypothetical protein [Candidatus Neomarinimicrobiota bacterium]
MIKTLSLPKSMVLIPVEEKHLPLMLSYREKHPAWRTINEEQLHKAFHEKWRREENQPARWLITIHERVYGEIGWKSYTPGDAVYLDLIVYRKELYNLDLARHCVVPFVKILTRTFRIHTIRWSVLRPDPFLERFLGSMHFRQISVHYAPPRDFFPGGVMASYEVECDHLIHKFNDVPKIQWNAFQLIPFKLLDVDSAPFDFLETVKTYPHEKRAVLLTKKDELIAYYQSLPHDLEIKTVLFFNENNPIKIGTAILYEKFPDSFIWHPTYNTLSLDVDLFACLLNTLRRIPVISSGHIHRDQKRKQELLKIFNFIQDSISYDGFSSWHLETVALPDKDFLLSLHHSF